MLRLEGSFVWVRSARCASSSRRHATSSALTAAARERFRMSLLRRFYEEYGRVLGGARDPQLRRGRAVRCARRLPRPRAQGRRGRSSSPRQARPLAAHVAAARSPRPPTASSTPDEQKLLRRRGAGWSDADIPLLDEARALLVAPPHAYGHVIVDEAQDLTPMQLRMVARRARDGSLTILGDVAQGTGAGRVLELGRGAAAPAARRRGRRRGAAPRLPRAARDHGARAAAARRIAPDVAPPIAYRTGAAPPRVRRVGEDDLLAEAYREAEKLAAEDGLLAVIVPDELAARGRRRTASGTACRVLTPRDAQRASSSTTSSSSSRR